ncbi:hypothetical protein J2754_001434 [Halarchaeum solikamskense]|nr:hypothetical protein [Halarchaeum solikamskense]
MESLLLLKEFKDAVLHPTEWVRFVVVLLVEDVTLREVFDRPDEESLSDEEVTRVLLGDVDESRSSRLPTRTLRVLVTPTSVVTISAIRQNF